MDKADNDPDVAVVFRRFVTLKDGRVLDARAYGKRAWPIRIRKP